MNSYRFRFYMTVTMVLFLCSMVLAQNAGNHQTSSKPVIIDEFLANFHEAQEKIIALAQEIPQKDYSWRPGPGVRSVSEAFVHAATANYFFMKLLGIKATEKYPRNAEKVLTSKEEIVPLLKKAFKFANEKMSTMTEKQLNEKVKFFGQKLTRRAVLLAMVSHTHEHLGQLIAYTRSVGAVPPWSKKK